MALLVIDLDTVDTSLTPVLSALIKYSNTNIIGRRYHLSDEHKTLLAYLDRTEPVYTGEVPATLEEYQAALNVVIGRPGYLGLSNGGWHVVAKTEARNRSKKVFFEINNFLFGTKPMLLEMNKWRRVKNAMTENGSDCLTIQQTKEALTLLLLYAKPSFIDLPVRTQGTMASLGYHFVLELTGELERAFVRSDYVDYSVYWQRKYRALEKKIGLSSGEPGPATGYDHTL